MSATTSSLPRTQNEAWGFYGTIIQHATCDGDTNASADATANAAWDAATTAIADAIGADPEQDGIREFLDSSHGRHFADDVCNGLYHGSTLTDAIDAAVTRWMGWTTKRRDERRTGIPAGLPYLAAYVVQAAIDADATA